MQKENRSNTKNELAPPFTASAAAKSTPADSDDSPEPVDTYRQKFLRYLKKKYSVKTKRHIYKARQQVAERRLRIEGRFVTKKQAYEILGMDEGSLQNADTIQELLTAHANDKKKINSNIQASKSGGRVYKVQNFQALIKDTWKHTADEEVVGQFVPNSEEHIKKIENEANELEIVNLRVNANNQVCEVSQEV